MSFREEIIGDATLDELREEVARVSKLCSKAHHAAIAASFMGGGTGKPHIARRDALLAHLRAAALAPDKDRAKHIEILRGLT